MKFKSGGLVLQGQEATHQRRRWGTAALRLTSLGVVAVSTAGCAVSYVDSTNVRHVIGFVDVALPAAPAEASGSTPSVVSVTSVGVHVYSGTSTGSGVVLGYGKETALTMPNNACVDLNAPGVCAAAATRSAQTAHGKAQE